LVAVLIVLSPRYNFASSCAKNLSAFCKNLLHNCD
jgi:hypothetical protein